MSPRKTAYANGEKILSKTLLRRIYKSFAGGILWIPPRVRRRIKTAELDSRNREIRTLARRGTPLRDLARKYLLSVERVRQIARGGKK